MGGFAPAVAQRTHAMADVEAQVPQQAHECGDFLLGRTRFLDEDQQIDVRMRMQFGASVAADGKQRQTVVVLKPVLPDFRQERVDEASAFGNQRLYVFLVPEPLGEGLVGLPNAPL